jgi:hypothetical protein
MSPIRTPQNGVRMGLILGGVTFSMTPNDVSPWPKIQRKT